MKKLILTLSAVLLFSFAGWTAEQETPGSSMGSLMLAQETSETDAGEEAAAGTEVETDAPEHGFGHKLLFYIPNRILDVFDFLRLRLRVGPGIAVGARVTKPLSFFIGGYGSVFVGLPGPRMEPVIKLPIGFENYGGIGISFLETTDDGRFSPNYSPTEIGASLQLLIVGTDIGVDPVEILDLATGFIFIDIRGDDL